jgi:hypothetical protein
LEWREALQPTVNAPLRRRIHHRHWAAACSTSPDAPLTSAVATASRYATEERDILFSVKTDATPEQRRAFEGLARKYGLTEKRRLAGGRVIHSTPANRQGATTAAIIADLQATGALEYAEEDVVVKPATVPSDTLFGAQWHLARTNAPAAWSYSTGSHSVVVAVCHVGVQLNHPDLAGALRQASRTSGPKPSSRGRTCLRPDGRADSEEKEVGVVTHSWIPVSVPVSSGTNR